MQDNQPDHLDPLVAPILKGRKDQKMTQQELADMAGISRRTLILIEQGGDCALSTLRRLYTALGITVQSDVLRPPTLDEQISRNHDEFREMAQVTRQRQRG